MDANTRALALWLILECEANEREAERVRAMPRISAELFGKQRGLQLVLRRLARQQGFEDVAGFVAAVRRDPANRTAISEGEARALECGANEGLVRCVLRRAHPGWHRGPLGHRWAPEASDISEGEARALDGNR